MVNVLRISSLFLRMTCGRNVYAIVLSWIMISISRDLLSGIVYACSAQQV